MKLDIIITKENSGGRIDKFLVELAKKKKELKNLSRADFARAIKNGEILVNDKRVKQSYVLKNGDKMRVPSPLTPLPKGEGDLMPNPKVKFKIIYKDENIIAVNKPAGLLAHPDFKERKNTLVNGLIAKFPEIKNVGEDLARPGIVHRLDKDTSGVMVIARNQKSFKELKKLFKNRKVRKRYLAVIYGKLKNKSGVIEKSLARAGNYKKQVIAGRKTKTKIRLAATEYKVLKEFKGYSLVEARPRTGRMHQVRVHFFSLGHPVAGDKIYKIKSKLKSKQINAKRQLLHAGQIKFELLGKKYSFSSPLPSDFGKFKTYAFEYIPDLIGNLHARQKKV